MTVEIDKLDRSGPAANALLALVVATDSAQRDQLADVLAEHYRVKSVARPSDIQELAEELEPAVIVSSVELPGGVDGHTLCRRLRACGRTRAIPILLITKGADGDGVLAAFEAGATDCVRQPFHGRELLARVDVHVGMRKMAHDLALSERHAMLGVMAASIAHQVRNPLTTLVAGLPAMRSRMRDKVDGATSELVEVMVECAERIERLTRDLMDISRVDREPSGAFNPADGLRSAVRLAKARVIGNAMIEDDVRDGVLIEGRAGDINHVFLNLIDNAIRAVGETGRVRITASIERMHYTVHVGDSGSGIDSVLAERIFEPFFTTRPAGEGTGLGLAIARQIVEQHGGEIVLGRSELGGALFTVRLPIEIEPERVSLAS